MKTLSILFALLFSLPALCASPIGQTADFIRNDYTITPVTVATPVAMFTLPYPTGSVQIFDTNGTDMKIICGVTVTAYPPGGGTMPLKCSAGSVISVQGITATANTGELLISFYYQ